jgi:hypothetical protein
MGVGSSGLKVMNFADHSEEDSAAHRLAAHFGVWILELLWFLELGF